MDKYLKRIGYRGAVGNDLASLNALVIAQLTHVPFENLDIWSTGICPSMQVEDLYRKIVMQGRGGYCFELNTLFRQLLNYLGFDAYHAVSSLVNDDGSAQPAAHNVIICTLEGKKYLIDVGFGGPVPFGAMPLREGVWENFKLSQKDGFWYLDRWEVDHYRPSIRFRDVPASMEELIPLNFYISQKPDSHFRHRVNVSIKKPDGSIHRIIGNELHVKVQGVVSDQIIDNGQLHSVLMEHFGIWYTQIPEGKPLNSL